MKKKIIIITTGGTIAMKKDEKTGGLVPAVSGADLVSAIPGLSHAADIEVREFSNIPSGWMTVEKMFALSREIDKLAAENAADGFVITHGTDTLEETAFFLYITLRTEKPVCVTGAMRGGHEISADGPENILSAVRIAADDMTGKMGVVVCLGDRIYSAGEVTKVHTTNPDTFRDLHYGPLGTVSGNAVLYGRIPVAHKKIHPSRIEPHVWIIPTWSGMDGEIVKSAKGKAKGVIIDGLGCGNVPPECKKAIAELRKTGIPVVLTTRVPTGSIMEEYSYDGSIKSMKDLGIISGGTLSAPKARLLLSAALGITNDNEQIRSYFET